VNLPLTSSSYDRQLRELTHPPGWRNPVPPDRYALVVLGGGTAGLVTAAAAAGLGARVALVERSLLGGDCLNTGCVPSKALLASARAAAAARRAGTLGVRLEGEVAVDFPAVMERMRGLRADIAHHDSAERFRGLGVDVFLGDARFTAPDQVQVGTQTLRFRRAVIATGGRAAVPPVPGLVEAGFLTNETVFNLTALPRRLVVVGGGPIGCELAQAFARLGSRVTLFQAAPRLLEREDGDAAELLAEVLQEEGVDLRLGARLERVQRRGSERICHFEVGGAISELSADEILVAAGRRPNLEGLALEAAGVAHTARGVTVDDFLRTTNRRIFAAGDVALPYQFTHLADASARLVVQNALFPWKKRFSSLIVPWSTYTEPEIAHVGLYEQQAWERGIAVETLTVPFADVDRAILEGETRGFVRLHVTRKKGRILGATIVGPHAGELISEVSVAIAGELSLGRIGSVIHPYPTLGEALRKAGDDWNRRRLTPRLKRVLGSFLALRFGRSAIREGGAS
jgi:pyruvate/2-oxoglutarate dehydrogenase complex dihydrolipoamide dehydrogenase (E3) component